MVARNSQITSTTVTYGLYLIFQEDGGVRLTRTEPQLGRYERSMFVEVSLPRSLWRQPSLRGSIVVPDGGAKPVIDIEAAQGALRSVLGVDIDLRVSE